MSFALPLLAGTVAGQASALQPIQNSISYAINRAFPNTIVGGADIIDLYRRGHFTKQIYYDLMKFYGYNTEQAKFLYLSQDSLLTPEQALLYR